MYGLDTNHWVISPAGGVTGEAYIAQSPDNKIFIKRNSSPFLAVLSAEGIVPKLLWTKRLANGDVITAQKCLEARELTVQEMGSRRVARLLKKIHGSEPLVFMLAKLGKEALTTKSILLDLMTERKRHPLDPAIQEALSFLKQTALAVEHPVKRVCHSDINHNNWLLDEDDQLYLIDWDQAVIADPALDLGMTLYGYVEEPRWGEWLTDYGYPLTTHLRLRMHWYMLANTITFMFWHQSRYRLKEAADYRQRLVELNGMSRERFASGI
ncbi:phosphotransferase [Pullulanibacillus camelliae]|uniref:Phosphotransferase n=1 Tax=Pullulanibacillus camelliae TaxID=1707096 RepID=A0A8J2YNQ6_9BACL|nr:phosphotransferase [Pullulanibacillus camelliae]